MREIQLVVSDMDGTLLTSHKTVSHKNRQTIEKLYKAGIPFVLATGRSMAEIRRSVDDAVPVSSYVTLNGAKVYGKDGSILQEERMPKESLEAIYTILMEKGVYFEGVFEDEVYSFSQEGRKRIVGKILSRQKGRPATQEEIVSDVRYESTKFFDESDWKESFVQAPVHKLRVYESPTVPIKSLFEALQVLDQLELSASNDWSLEVNTKKATKGNGVATVAKALGIPLESIVAIGDHLNDVSMLETVGIPVAVSNASDVVKQAAQIVVSSNDDDGFTEAVNRLIFCSNN